MEKKTFEVVVVMPVYNEEEIIEHVLNDWSLVLDKLNINYKIIVLNDGSKDGTLGILESIKSDRLEVVDKLNSGHGPTVVYGYKKAINEADWVFQVDSDNEIPASEFVKFWDERKSFDFILGQRVDRGQSFSRKVLTYGLKFISKLIFQGEAVDVNCPYRLMRSSFFHRVIRSTPDDSLIPNALLSSCTRLLGARTKSIDVYYKKRQTGVESISYKNFLKFGVMGAGQLFLFRFKLVFSGKVSP